MIWNICSYTRLYLPLSNGSLILVFGWLLCNHRERSKVSYLLHKCQNLCTISLDLKSQTSFKVFTYLRWGALLKNFFFQDFLPLPFRSSPFKYMGPYSAWPKWWHFEKNTNEKSLGLEFINCGTFVSLLQIRRVTGKE